MNMSALVMMLFGCITIWGGLFINLTIALQTEKSKSSESNSDTKL